MSKISIIGAGAWGTTLAILLAENHHEVSLWCFEKEVAESINEFRENKKYLPGFQLIYSITAHFDLKTALAGSDFIIFSVPTQHIRQIAKEAHAFINPGTCVISAAKGIEASTLKRPSEILKEFLKNEVAALSGPNLSIEIAKGLPAASTVASNNNSINLKAQELLNSERFRVYTNNDIVGVELGGALKNVIAIAAGAIDGLQLGDNAKSALLIRGITEISRLGIALNANPKTFTGLSGMGDLITTCQSSLSRNHKVGFGLAKGKSLKEIQSSSPEVAEGVPTSSAALRLAQKHKVEMPITQEVCRVLFEGKDVYQAITTLMNRIPTSE